MYTIQYWPGLSNNLLLLLHLCDNKVKLFSVSSLTTINVTHIHLDNNCINKIHHKVRIIEKNIFSKKQFQLVSKRIYSLYKY